MKSLAKYTEENINEGLLDFLKRLTKKVWDALTKPDDDTKELFYTAEENREDKDIELLKFEDSKLAIEKTTLKDIKEFQEAIKDTNYGKVVDDFINGKTGLIKKDIIEDENSHLYIMNYNENSVIGFIVYNEKLGDKWIKTVNAGPFENPDDVHKSVDKKSREIIKALEDKLGKEKSDKDTSDNKEKIDNSENKEQNNDENNNK